jgi:hypothetical protein
MIKPYPLQWPVGYPRTQRPQRARFKTTFAYARDNALREIRALGGKDAIISTDIPTKLDGMPYADASRRSMKSQGVAVYFNYNGEPVVFCCDKWMDVADNMQAVYKSIEAIRGLDRWGVSEMLKRVFTGFEALPESAGEWFTVLDISETATPEEVKSAWRSKTLVNHPDKGGNAEEYNRINAAYQKYLSMNKPNP